MTSSRQEPLRLAIVGCGALAELYAAPALRSLEARRLVRVTHLVDPAPQRTQALGRTFPGAGQLTGIERLDTSQADAAMVCSPARFHAAQAEVLLRAGLAVLCEKPMAASPAGCAAMNASARVSGRPLAIGHFRRFAPALALVRAWILSGRLGRVRSVQVTEGGPFDWPAATASFFDRASAGGGVFLDVGAHVLDVLFWWLGAPNGLRYRDDAAGGLEANCLAELTWQSGATASVRLSRDWRTPGLTRVLLEGGELRWRMGAPDQIEVLAEGLPMQLVRAAEAPARTDGWGQARPAAGWNTAYAAQLAAFVSLARGQPSACATGEEGALAVEWISRGYVQREPWDFPWLEKAESLALAKLQPAGGVS
jgi:predicted dehydrogenase